MSDRAEKVFLTVMAAIVVVPLLAMFYFEWHFDVGTVKTSVTSKHWFWDRCGAKIYHDCKKFHLVVTIEGKEVHFSGGSSWYDKVPVGAEVEVAYGKSMSGDIGDMTMWYPARSK